VFRFACFSAGVVLSMASPRALAQSRQGGVEVAEALFRSGRERVEAGDYTTAYAMFLESNRVDFAAGTVMNLAACEEHLGKVASAWVRYRELFDILPRGDDRRPFVADSIARLERLVPRLTVFLVNATIEGIVVREDGAELTGALLGADLPLDPGAHVVEIRAPGRVTRRYAVTLAQGDRETVDAEVGELLPPAPWRVANGRRIAAEVVGGSALGAVSLGVVLGVHALSERSVSDAFCKGGMCTTQAALDAYRSARSTALAADVAFGVGAVALGVAGYLFATSAQPRAVAVAVPPAGIALSW
jgi:hypothetical protein